MRSWISAKMRREGFNWQLSWAVSTISVVSSGSAEAEGGMFNAVRQLVDGEVHNAGDIRLRR
jgi:hypothetical protein